LAGSSSPRASGSAIRVGGRRRSTAQHAVSAEDRKSNFDALFDGERIISAYPINPALPSQGFGANTLWIVTEADRSVTTFLLPDEY
jgi:hypothetical protein